MTIAMTLSEDILKILACPRCRGPVQPAAGGDRLLCDTCRLAYPVRDGIPVMLVDEAEELSP